MNFIVWLEQTQLLKQYGKNLKFLGHFGWWDVYASPSPNSSEDKLNDIIFNSAASALSRIGFPKMRSTIVITDLTDVKNQITGGGVGGFADTIKHGIAIDSKYLNLDFSYLRKIIIHEHAHMYWKILPKYKKQLFINWYENNVRNLAKNQTISANDLLLDGEFKSKFLSFADSVSNLFNLSSLEIPRVYSFKELQDLINLKEYIKSDKNDDKIILKALPNVHFHPVITKKDFKLSGQRGTIDVKAGSKISIFKGGGTEEFIITKTVDGYSYDKNLGGNVSEILSSVELEPPDDRVKNIIKFASKLNLSSLLASKSKSDKINKEFIKLANKVVENLNNFLYERAKSKYGNQSNKNYLNYNDIFTTDDFWSSWASIIGRRIKKPFGWNEFRQAISDTLTKKMSNPSLIKIPISTTNILEKPFGDASRQLISYKLNLPSGYSSANVDELWATIAEDLATNHSSNSLINVSYKELRNLFFTILSP